eukprot:Clim_evm39s33 gene=Clim_evmTU39s33
MTLTEKTSQFRHFISHLHDVVHHFYIYLALRPQLISSDTHEQVVRYIDGWCEVVRRNEPKIKEQYAIFAEQARRQCVPVPLITEDDYMRPMQSFFISKIIVPALIMQPKHVQETLTKLRRVCSAEDYMTLQDQYKCARQGPKPNKTELHRPSMENMAAFYYFSSIPCETGALDNQKSVELCFHYLHAVNRKHGWSYALGVFCRLEDLCQSHGLEPGVGQNAIEEFIEWHVQQNREKLSQVALALLQCNHHILRQAAYRFPDLLYDSDVSVLRVVVGGLKRANRSTANYEEAFQTMLDIVPKNRRRHLQILAMKTYGDGPYAPWIQRLGMVS